MLAIIYLVLCFTFGYVFCAFLLPGLETKGETTCNGGTLRLSRVFILIPAWYITGTIFITWITYLSAYVFKSAEKPLFYGNIISMGFALAVSAVGILFLVLKKKGLKLVSGPRRLYGSEALFILAVFVLAFTLMYRTFNVANNTLRVGVSVFSDFAPHLGTIRSFSLGNNFPTTYSHYAGIDIRYHFMFQFMVGNLEFLGLRLDHAFNIPSILSYVFSFFLLYALALRLTGKRLAGFLSCLFYAFRCSPSLFTFLGDLDKKQVLKTIIEDSSFIGYTTHEDWGLWNLNVYCNQRHLATGICVLLIMVHLFLENLFDMVERWRLFKSKHDMMVAERRMAEEQKRLEAYEALCAEAAENGEDEPEEYEPLKESKFESVMDTVTSFIVMSFFRKDGWMPKRILVPVVAGFLLGATAFWNGAAVLAAIMVLFFFAVVADNRLEYLLTALITASLAKLETSFFVKNAEIIETKLQYGFIAENPSFFGTLDYVMRLCGILIPVLFIAFIYSKGIKKWILFAFSVPFIFSFYVSLTVDVTVNHKYIMISIMLMNIFAAALVTKLYENRSGWVKLLATVIVILMTITGVYDFTTVMKKNNPQNGYLVYQMQDPLVDWISENTTSQDIFLTSHYALSRPVLGGAMLYQGHAYYPLTAGYDTNLRYRLSKKMFECTSRTELIKMIRENLITYVIIDSDARTTGDFNLNEELFKSTFECVYTEGDGNWKIDIYDTSKLKAE
ncbi:MAG: hypothetical protein J6113_02435 [Lachnospiraceae bacterium]|nr:hypothetical protein [Lachnospiraceae bacterium]